MMKTEQKVIIRVEPEEPDKDNKTTSSRRTLKVLQRTATDKENLAGRPQTLKDAKTPKAFEKRRKLLMQHKTTQTECVITAEDLTSDEPSLDYWKKLAETRADSLNRSLQENEKLKEDIEVLQEENRICKEMLEESTNLVEVLQEMLDENDDDEDDEDL